MRRRKRRDDFIDNKIISAALIYTSWARRCWPKAFATTRESSIEVSLGLHRALSLRPWQLEVFDFEISTMTTTPPYRRTPALNSFASFIAGSWRWQEAR